jgi:hypothetical protein
MPSRLASFHRVMLRAIALAHGIKATAIPCRYRFQIKELRTSHRGRRRQLLPSGVKVHGYSKID